MESEWIGERPLRRALQRHEAFWDGALDDGPLMWVTAPGARPGPARRRGSRRRRSASGRTWTTSWPPRSTSCPAPTTPATPCRCTIPGWVPTSSPPGWAPLTLAPRLNTSWIAPFVKDWSRHPRFPIDPDNRWWRLYLEILEGSVRAGRDKWVTAYPDLHTGIDALSALRGPEHLLADLVERPDAMHGPWADDRPVEGGVDRVEAVILPAGQGTSNWTMGWSARRFLCIGQNDFTCMISPRDVRGVLPPGHPPPAASTPTARSTTWTAPGPSATCRASWGSRSWTACSGSRGPGIRRPRSGWTCSARSRRRASRCRSTTGPATAATRTWRRSWSPLPGAGPGPPLLLGRGPLGEQAEELVRRAAEMRRARGR